MTRGAAWIGEAARVLGFQAPRWERLRGGPWTIAGLVALALAAGTVLKRLEEQQRDR